MNKALRIVDQKSWKKSTKKAEKNRLNEVTIIKNNCYCIRCPIQSEGQIYDDFSESTG
jgi:hypothetical protein